MSKIINYEFLKIWIYNFDLPLMPISAQEDSWKEGLSEYKKFQFHFSRGYARQALSNQFNIKPLKVPLFAEPNKPPLLEKDFGYVSISHCQDSLIIGWSNSQLGIDIESKYRCLNVQKLSDYLFSFEEKKYLNSSKNNFKEEFLSIWVQKEALVKFSHGHIIRDFKNWEIDFLHNKATNIKTSKKIFVNSIKYKNWIIGFASEKIINKNN